MLVASGQIAIPPETHVFRYAVRKYLSFQFLGWADLCRLILALFESHHLFYLWDINLHRIYEKLFNLPNTERSLARIIDEVYGCYREDHFSSAKIWGDQSPINTFFISWVHETFPRAKFLHLLRDGRDAIASLIKRGVSLEEATERWVKSIQETRSIQPHLKPGQYCELRYEDLVTNQTKMLQDVCKFIGINYQDIMLDYWKLPTTLEHKHFEYHENIKKPVFTDSIGKWRERLTKTELNYVLEKTSKLLADLDYL
jgi:hypothetical protein